VQRQADSAIFRLNPEFRRFPVALHCGRRNLERLSRFRNRKAAEKPHLHHLTLPGVQFLQLLQCQVNREDVHPRCAPWRYEARNEPFVQSNLLGPATSCTNAVGCSVWPKRSR
jgi:hypothetical protein